jgi:hypothetical protein
MSGNGKMTPEQARTFSKKSPDNYAYVLAVLTCNCEPYQDVFTYARWQAQGLQVQKNEKSIKTTTWIPIVKTDAETGEDIIKGTRPKTTSLFCRCQVENSDLEKDPERVPHRAEQVQVEAPTETPDNGSQPATPQEAKDAFLNKYPRVQPYDGQDKPDALDTIQDRLKTYCSPDTPVQDETPEPVNQAPDEPVSPAAEMATRSGIYQRTIVGTGEDKIEYVNESADAWCQAQPKQYKGISKITVPPALRPGKRFKKNASGGRLAAFVQSPWIKKLVPEHSDRLNREQKEWLVRYCDSLPS